MTEESSEIHDIKRNFLAMGKACLFGASVALFSDWMEATGRTPHSGRLTLGILIGFLLYRTFLRDAKP